MRCVLLSALFGLCGACGAGSPDVSGTWATVQMGRRETPPPVLWTFADKSLTLSYYRSERPALEEAMPYTLDDSVAPPRLFIEVSSDEDSLSATLLFGGTGILVHHDEFLVIKLGADRGMIPKITSPDAEGFVMEQGFVTWWLKRIDAGS